MQPTLSRIIFFTLSIYFLSLAACKGHPASSPIDGQDSLSPKLERGRYLVETVASCMHCHSDRDFTKFSGPLKRETEGMGGVAYPIFGVLYSSNITPDSATGIGSWTDAQIARAITQGIDNKGDTLFPIMPYYEYNKLCSEDVNSVVAYLRTLPSIRNKIPARQLKTSAGAERLLFSFTATDKNKLPPTADTLATGEYLTALAGCITCHTPKDDNDRFETDKFYSGGDRMGKKFGFTVVSPNITADTMTGIGSWTSIAFTDKFKSFLQPAAYTYEVGTHNTIMPWTQYAGMTEADLGAIYAYLRTVRPISNKIEKWPVVELKIRK